MTLTALVFFIWVIVFVSDHNPLESVDYYDVTFPDAGLLQTGDLVRLNGIPIGKVERIGLSSDRVLVRISANSTVKIRTDARIVVGDVGLFGTNYIKISQYRTTKNPEYWKPNDVIPGSEEPGFEELLNKGQDLVTEAKNTFEALNQIMADEDFHKDVKGVFRDLKESTESTKRMFASLETRTDSILKDVNEVTGSLKEDTDLAGRKAVVAMERLDRTLEQLEELSRENRENLTRTVASMTRMVTDFEGDGTAVAELHAILANLRDVTETLKRFSSDVEADGETATRIKAITTQADDVTRDLAEVASGVKDFVLDPQTKDDIRQAFKDVNSLATNIDQATSAVSSVRFRLQTALYYSGELDDFRADFTAGITFGDRYVLRAGFDDVGSGEGLNTLQVGMRLGRSTWIRTGLVSDEMGLGLDLPLARDRFRLSLEVFDPDDLVYRALGSFKAGPSTRVGVWYENAPDSTRTYGGILQEF